MLNTYVYPTYAYRRPSELDAPQSARHPLVVVGAGPVGLAVAIDLAQQGQRVLLLDDDNTVSVGSRGLCYAKRTLEILDRLGCGAPVVDKGVTWNVGRTFHRDAEVFKFDLLPEAGHRRPGMVNLQQYYLEQYLVERAQTLPLLDLRWRHKVVQMKPRGQGATLTVETADGSFNIETDWLVVADGARSPIRRMMGLDMEGKVFQDRFLIADVVMKADFPAERWFWFDPPFHRNQSVLLHREADNVWRIDFQLGWDADPEEEKKPERVLPRIRAMLGPDRDFELEWVSVYTFQCRRMQKFRHGHVLFLGDAAHQVSPFGARGANSGIQDADNLAWKLKLVIDGLAPDALLDSYSDERMEAADENLMNSTRSTDFITPKSNVSKLFRNAVLTLAGEHAFARALVNSGRLSVPSHHPTSPLNTLDRDVFESTLRPGSPMPDAPVRHEGRDDDWLLSHVGGRFVLLWYLDGVTLEDTDRHAIKALASGPLPVHTVIVTPGQAVEHRANAVGARASMEAGVTWLEDTQGFLARRLDAQPGSAYLLRPDQLLTARWRAWTPHDVQAAVARATCNRITPS